jgi:hypothetical protein
MSVKPLLARSVVTAALTLLLLGCAGGLIGYLPVVTQPRQASDVTVFRDGSLPGFIGPITLRIDDRKILRVWRNEQFSFQLDPGEYLFYYTIGLNECRRVAYIQPNRTYRFRLAPNCDRFDGPF